MPYPNEHACRLNEPNKYERFVRKNGEIKIDGKPVDVIYGITKEGKAEIQALRYPKKDWSPEAANTHCQTREGRFEPASSNHVGFHREPVICEEIFLGKVRNVLLPESLAVDHEKTYILTDGEYLYGTLLFLSSTKLKNHADFKGWKNLLKVPDDEYLRISSRDNALVYSISFEPFDEPKGLIKNDDDIESLFVVKDGERYKPSLLTDEELRKDWEFLLSLHNETKKRGGNKDRLQELLDFGERLLREIIVREIKIETFEYNFWSRNFYERIVKRLREKHYGIKRERDCKCGLHKEPERTGGLLEYLLPIEYAQPSIKVIERNNSITCYVSQDEVDPVMEYTIFNMFPSEYFDKLDFVYMGSSHSVTDVIEPHVVYTKNLSVEFVQGTEKEKTTHTFSSTVELTVDYTNYSETDYSLNSSTETPAFLDVSGILFRPGNIKNVLFTEEELSKAVLKPTEDRRLCYVNLHHKRDETERIGILTEIKYDSGYVWYESGSKKEHKGALLFRATITDKETIRHILVSRFWTVSAELCFDTDEKGIAREIDVCGMAFTPAPAVHEAAVSRICDPKGECKTVENPLL